MTAIVRAGALPITQDMEQVRGWMKALASMQTMATLYVGSGLSTLATGTTVLATCRIPKRTINQKGDRVIIRAIGNLGDSGAVNITITSLAGGFPATVLNTSVGAPGSHLYDLTVWLTGDASISRSYSRVVNSTVSIDGGLLLPISATDDSILTFSAVQPTGGDTAVISHLEVIVYPGV